MRTTALEGIMQHEAIRKSPECSLYNESQVLQSGSGKCFIYNKDATVCSLIEQVVAENPTRLAIKYNNKTLSYQQLNEKANQIAHFLKKNGVKALSNVAIYLEPSLELILCILAVLKVGGCYVPLDTNYPKDRLSFMLKDSLSVLLITQSDLVEKLETPRIETILIDKCQSKIKKENCKNLDCVITAKDSAYIIYTSGSTGMPKGIVVPHCAINNHMIWMTDFFDFKISDIFLLKTPISFDPSVWELFIPFYIGAQLVVAPMGIYLDQHRLITLIKRYQITIIQFVPSLLHEFLKEDMKYCESLRHIFVGGETLRTETKKLFFEKLHCFLHNVYGPSEATIQITSHTLTPTDYDINNNIIGRPIYNTQLYVLDHKMNLVKTGEEGELYIGGDSLSNGYLHKKIPNEKKFIVNQIDSDTKSKLYKTGDIVKWLESGDLLYVGRNNDQIKINGVRIEPNELVSHILKNPQVSNCIVTKKHDSSNHSFLACYIVPKKSNELDINNIKNALKDFFPRYMLPKTYTILKSIPLTINGKIDILALPEPLIEPRTQGSLEKNISNEERKLLTIWKNLMKYDNIHIEDNFFEIGGNSILAFQLLVNIKSTFRLSIHIKDIFLYPSIREQAALIHRLKKKKVKVKDINLNHSFQNSVIPLQRKGGGTPLFLIHPIGGTVFWYSTLAQLLGNSRPIYAIQDPAIECGKNIFSSIEEMADAYIALIQKIQPLGPYLIGGASFGATVAVEIANRLKKLNQETVFVTILDGWAVYPNTLLNDAYFKVSMERQHAVLKMEFEKYNLPDPRDLFSIQWHRLSLLWKYQLTEISCPIILFKAEEILPAFQEVDALLNHWEIYTKQPICSFVVPGNHETMFQMPQVRKLADALKKCLRKIKI